MKIVDIKLLESNLIANLEFKIKEALKDGFELKDSLQIRTYNDGGTYIINVHVYTQVMVKYE